MSAACVGSVEERGELPAVVARGVGGAPDPDQPVAAVNAEMVLVAKERVRDIDALRPVRGPGPTGPCGNRLLLKAHRLLMRRSSLFDLCSLMRRFIDWGSWDYVQ